ncbi:MAG: arsinothricin resistance N-acetyltransferase ArsN1 family B [Candidatus Eisenbacteria bacterium]
MASMIRLVGEQDAEQTLAIYAPIVRTTAVSFEVEPPTVNEMRERIGDTIARFPWLVCEHGGTILGYAYSGEHRAREAYRWSVDVSVYVHPRARRSGVGRALYRSLFEILTLQGFFNAYARIALPNPASVALHRSQGFQLVGVFEAVGYKLGAWHDVSCWRLSLQAPVVPPRPPIDIETAQKSPGWTAALTAGLQSLRLEGRERG